MTTRPLLLASAAVVVLTGCAGMRGWVEDAPPPPSHGSTRPETYYAVGALPVHAKPSDASRVVGRLAPNTRVMRTQVDRGWARIAADGVEGWVDASHLVHQPPPAGPPSPAPAAAPPAPSRPPPAIEDPF